MEALQLLLEKLNTGKIPISEEMLQQAGLGQGGAAGGGVVSGKGPAVDKMLARQKAERIALDKELRQEAEAEMDKLLGDFVSHYLLLLDVMKTVNDSPSKILGCEAVSTSFNLDLDICNPSLCYFLNPLYSKIHAKIRPKLLWHFSVSLSRSRLP